MRCVLTFRFHPSRSSAGRFRVDPDSRSLTAFMHVVMGSLHLISETLQFVRLARGN